MAVPHFIKCARADDIAEGSILAVNVEGRPVALAKSEGVIRAVDNRCPHMGFPLSRGTVQDGILICHWHHARFDLESGCTFDPFADDVRAYPVQVRDRNVYVNVYGGREDHVAYWKRRLEEGLQQNLLLIMAKAILALREAGVSSEEIVEVAGTWGARNRRAGWGPGMTILTAMTNVLPKLGKEEQFLALCQGLLHVSGETANSAPRIRLLPLEGKQYTLERLKQWFRYFIEVRNGDGAERALMTALSTGATAAQVCDMMCAAATDHFYRNGGHTIDFINKGFELLEHVGWDKADEVLPTLVGMIAGSSRAEEQNVWKSPINFSETLKEVFKDLDSLVQEGEGKEWHGEDALTELLLDDDPHATIEALKDAMRQGAELTQLTQTLAYAAAMRVARFHMKNELGDFIAVLHTFTYANALHQCAKRAPSVELLRGVFHGAVVVYFDRWFNTPAARLPNARRETATLPTDPDRLLKGLVEMMNTQQQVDQAAMWLYRYLSLGYPREKAQEALGLTLLREDAEFHSFQMLEGAFHLAEELDTERANMALVAAARYLAGHSPTNRALRQTIRLAQRLHRGDDLSAEDPDEVIE